MYARVRVRILCACACARHTVPVPVPAHTHTHSYTHAPSLTCTSSPSFSYLGSLTIDLFVMCLSVYYSTMTAGYCTRMVRMHHTGKHLFGVTIPIFCNTVSYSTIDIMTSQGMYSIVVGGSWNKVFVQYYNILLLYYMHTAELQSTIRNAFSTVTK